MTGSAATRIPVVRTERTSYFTPNNVTVSQHHHASSVKFYYGDSPRSSPIKAFSVTADEIASGSTALADLVASRVGGFPFRPPLTAHQAQSASHINCIPPVGP